MSEEGTCSKQLPLVLLQFFSKLAKLQIKMSKRRGFVAAIRAEVSLQQEVNF